MGQRILPLKQLKVPEWKGVPLQVAIPPVAWGLMVLKLALPTKMGLAATAVAKERMVIRAVEIILYILF
jgi:hypothetical protein